MKTQRQTLGRQGEEEACIFLNDSGHRIIARNWRNAHLELDIITQYGNELHIVEVKSRKAPLQADPQVNVGPQKRRCLTSAAKAFLHSPLMQGLPDDMEVYFDIITVVFYGSRPEIEYYPNAFIPTYV